MIDLHTHILPQVDDGPDDWEDALALLRQGIEDGITGAVSTSHILSDLNTDLEGRLIYRFEQLQKFVERDGLNISLWLASEIHCLARFDTHSRVATVNGDRKFLMIEFPMNEIPDNAGHTLFQLVIDGITPILAHPERNGTIQRNPDRIFSLVQRGVLMQINAGSLTGRFGRHVRDIALEMIEHRQAHFVASDGHSVRNRPMKMGDAYRVVTREFGPEQADRLFRRNPERVVRGESIEIPEPEPIRKRRPVKFSFFQKRMRH
ncbi:MAG TPA: hypothetical protein ENN17_06175 [bacterium]|nr:hypothetical protein [bacterium]